MILLVNPNAKVNRDIPNIGLAYAATYLNAKIIDLNTKPKPKNRFLEYKTDLLGISVQSRSYQEVLRIVKLYKEKHPRAEVKSISGFLEVQCCYPYLKLEEDMYFEQEFCDELRFPNYEFFDSFDLFKKNWQERIWHYAIMTSAGCPYQCTYCACRNSKWQARSAKNCYEEIKLAQERWRIRSFSIIDDCFNIDKDRVMEFCELIKPLELKWICANGLRADKFDEDTAKAMKDSGCYYVGFGIETIDSIVLEEIKKAETIEQIENAIDIAKRYFSGINGFFMIGLPKSSYEKDLRSLKWAKEKGINAFFSYYIPPAELTKGYLFYGKGTQPVSKEYPQRLQKKIYLLTESMRPNEKSEFKPKNLFKYFLKFFMV